MYYFIQLKVMGTRVLVVSVGLDGEEPILLARWSALRVLAPWIQRDVIFDSWLSSTPLDRGGVHFGHPAEVCESAKVKVHKMNTQIAK